MMEQTNMRDGAKIDYAYGEPAQATADTEYAGAMGEIDRAIMNLRNEIGMLEERLRAVLIVGAREPGLEVVGYISESPLARRPAGAAGEVVGYISESPLGERVSELYKMISWVNTVRNRLDV